MKYDAADEQGFPNAWIVQRIQETHGWTRFFYLRWWFHRHYGATILSVSAGVATGFFVMALR